VGASQCLFQRWANIQKIRIFFLDIQPNIKNDIQYISLTTTAHFEDYYQTPKKVFESRSIGFQDYL
jgi:hypothetical protein